MSFLNCSSICLLDFSRPSSSSGTNLSTGPPAGSTELKNELCWDRHKLEQYFVGGCNQEKFAGICEFPAIRHSTAEAW